MKKILFISPQPFFQWRGSPIRVSFNVLALAELGYSVDLLTLPIGERRQMKGVKVIRVANPFRVKQVPIGPSLHKIVFDFLILFKGMQLIRRQDYMVVHGVEEAGIIAVLLGWLAACKTIFEKHSDPLSHRKGFLKNMLLAVYAVVEKITVQKVDAVICTGPGLVDQVNEMKTSTPAFHIFDIPSSLLEPASEDVSKIRQGLQQQQDEILITFVGSFAVYQGVDLLIESIPEVVKHSSRARFVIIGGTEEDIEIRKAVLQQHDALQAVRFMGMIAPDILPTYLAASDILLSPRISGVNTPLKLLDYLKAGRSIVATDVEANRLILNEELAELAEPNPAAMAAAILALVNDGEKRSAMGQQGRRLYESTYNFRQYSKRLEACYAYVLPGQRNKVK